MGLGIGKDCKMCGEQILVTDSSDNICDECAAKIRKACELMEDAISGIRWED